MAGVLGAWRNGFATMMILLVAITVITVMSHENFASKAREIRQQLSHEVIAEIVPDVALREQIKMEVEKIPEQHHRIGVDVPLSQHLNLDTPYIDAVSTAVGQDGAGNFITQKFRVMYHQMMLAVSFRQILPAGMLGIFCLLMVMFMISTDT